MMSAMLLFENDKDGARQTQSSWYSSYVNAF